MKNSWLLALVIMMFSCGESQVEEGVEEVGNSETEEAEVDSVEVLSDSTDVSGDPWQINQYVEFLVGEEVHDGPEDFDWNDEKMHWYYEVIDVSGGYGKITGAIEGWQEFVLYRMYDGQDLVMRKSVGCGPVCSYDHTFYKGTNNGIKEIAFDEVLPMKELDAHREKMHKRALEEAEFPLDYEEDYQYDFLFPKKGTTLKIDLVLGGEEIRMELADLSWDKHKFTIEHLYETLQERQ